MLFLALLAATLVLSGAVFYVGVCRPELARTFWVLMACVVAAATVLVIELATNVGFYQTVFGGWGN